MLYFILGLLTGFAIVYGIFYYIYYTILKEYEEEED